MTVLSLPSSLVPIRQRWQEERQDIEFRSVFGSQILQPVPPVWATELEFDDRAEWLAGDIKALWLQLSGGNQLEAYDMARPAPLGTMRGTLTLAADVAQGATSMQLVRVNDNLVQFPEDNNNAYWSKSRLLAYGSGSTANAIIAPDGTLTGDKIVEDTQTGAHHTSKIVPMVAGQPITWSVHVRAGERSKAQLSIGNSVLFAPNATVRVNLLTGAMEASSSAASNIAISPAPNNWWRLSLKGTPLSSGNDAVFVFMANDSGLTSYAGDGTSGLYVWGAKLENGDLTDYGNGLTLLAGDLLGIGSGTTQQVVMVTQDATSTGQGNITVNFEHPLRNAFLAGTPVIWDKPKALFRLRQNRPGWDSEGPRAKGLKLDLVESVYA